MFFIIIFLYFWIISILGWLMEVLVCSLEKRKFIDRGFLIGPYCPIYGCGGLILISLSYFKNNLVIIFVFSLILCSFLEYFVSYLMEKIFDVRWWDYSLEPFNLHGRICLRNALAFGILGVVLVCFINPIIFKFLLNISNKLLLLLFMVIFILTLIDIIFSFKVMNSIKVSVKQMTTKNVFRDATDDIKLLIKNNLLSKSVLYRRFVKAYDDFEYYLEEVKVNLNDFDNKHSSNRKVLLLTFLVIGLVLGILLLIFFRNFRYGFMAGFGICIILGALLDKIRKK